MVSDVSAIIAHDDYANMDTIKITGILTELFAFYFERMRRMFTLWEGPAHLLTESNGSSELFLSKDVSRVWDPTGPSHWFAERMKQYTEFRKTVTEADRSKRRVVEDRKQIESALTCDSSGQIRIGLGGFPFMA